MNDIKYSSVFQKEFQDLVGLKKAHGFETWAEHILGKSDGQPKTPEWAAELTGIDAATIKALAREWAKKNTMLACGARGGWICQSDR
jgi:anaerobic selenocysteine-containing dehydrogenase